MVKNVRARNLLQLCCPRLAVPCVVALVLTVLPVAAETFVLPAVPAIAQARAAAIDIQVAPDKSDWTYQVGAPARFIVRVIADNRPLAGVPITYSIGLEKMPAKEHPAVIPPDGTLVLEGGTMQQAGFLRCTVRTSVANRNYTRSGTAGFSPEKIQPTQIEPADFDQFWANSKSNLAKIPLDATRTLLPDLCTDKVNVYHVSIRTLGFPYSEASRVYGILCLPKAPGRYPANLQLPGAGIRPYSGSPELAARGVITLQIGVHGIPVNLPPELYTQLANSALRDYNVIRLDDRENYYYHRVYLSCVRANDYLCSLPEFDGQNLVVTGGSQGGQLTIVTAALDPRVRALAAYYPAYCDVTGYLHGRAGGWPHMMRPDPDTGAPSHHATPEKIAVTGYYDVVNFARRVRAPGQYAWGYNDDVCPPTSTFSAYNVITAPKRLLLALSTTHQTVPEESTLVDAWIAEVLGLK